MFSSLFHTALYQPLFNGFVGLYNIIPGHDVGIVILAVTILIRLILFFHQSAKVFTGITAEIRGIEKTICRRHAKTDPSHHGVV